MDVMIDIWMDGCRKTGRFFFLTVMDVHSEGCDAWMKMHSEECIIMMGVHSEG